MILPIVPYGNSVLRSKCIEISKNFSGLSDLISDMWETMYNSNGAGIAAPQINRPIRLFIVDTIQIVNDFNPEERLKFCDEKPIKKIFINSEILEEIGEDCLHSEGCLSLPFIREMVSRKKSIKIKYLDENFNEHIEIFDGITARVVQHEYDHIEGKLFIDRLSILCRKLLKGKLDDIIKNKVKTKYKILRNKF